MSRSKKDKKQGKQDFSLKRDVRKDKNRGFRRHVKLEIKAGNYELPEQPRSKRVNDDVTE